MTKVATSSLNAADRSDYDNKAHQGTTDEADIPNTPNNEAKEIEFYCINGVIAVANKLFFMQAVKRERLPFNQPCNKMLSEGIRYPIDPNERQRVRFEITSGN